MILQKIFYFLIVLFLAGCSFTSDGGYPPDLENNELQPINTNQNHRLMIDKNTKDNNSVQDSK